MKQLKNCKHCNQPLTGRYKRFCGKPKCREAAKREHNEQCRIRNGKDKLKVCCCGCNQVFHRGIAGRKYFNSSCRTRMSVRKLKAKEPRAAGDGLVVCKICPTEFKPKNQRHVTCSPACAKERKRRKNLLRSDKRIPATHKMPEVAPVFERREDWSHKKYEAKMKKDKELNGRVCREDGCDVKCVGVNNHYCEYHRIANCRKADNCAFLDEGGSARRSASGIFG